MVPLLSTLITVDVKLLYFLILKFIAAFRGSTIDIDMRSDAIINI
jgi:hypothetical protein